VADGVREFLLQGSPDFLAQLQETAVPDPWRFGFAIVLTAESLVIGLCGFAGPPDSDGSVEMAYSIAPAYQGKGYATEAATALIEFATSSKAVRAVCAHTLPESNASTRVLEKCGLKKSGEIRDAENNLVWKWQKS
jgi:[ribosomal protein S5]-alanine N-acetyltransferase